MVFTLIKYMKKYDKLVCFSSWPKLTDFIIALYPNYFFLIMSDLHLSYLHRPLQNKMMLYMLQSFKNLFKTCQV